MGKRALLVGINKYKYVTSLNGCVNDVRNMADILTSFYGFQADEIRTIVDESVTRNNLMDRFDWLLDEAREGDILVFHFSGHGSQIQDRDGDELEDGLDEILCLHDMDFRNPDSYLLDDDFNNIIDRLPKGTILTVCIDSCHSGTATRDTTYLTSRLQISSGEIKLQPRFIEPPADVALRSYHKPTSVRRMGSRMKEDKKNTESASHAGAKHILLSGCMDDQTSADAFINSDYNGAFTYNLCKIIRDTRGTITYQELIKRVQNSLAFNSFSQIPQIFENTNLINNRFLSATSATELTCEHGHPLVCKLGHPPKNYDVIPEEKGEERKRSGLTIRRRHITSRHTKCAVAEGVVLLPASEFAGTVRELTELAIKKSDGARRDLGEAYMPGCLDSLENDEHFKLEKVLEFCPAEQRAIGISENVKSLQLAIREGRKRSGAPENETVMLAFEDGVWSWHFKNNDGNNRGLIADQTRRMKLFTIHFKVQDRTTRGIWSKILYVFTFKNDVLQEATSDSIQKMLGGFEERVITEGFKLIDLSTGFGENNLSIKDPVKDWDSLKAKVNDGKKALLFIHGTGSSLAGGYESVPVKILEALKEKYPVILGYDHFTLSKTPADNAGNMLKTLKESGLLEAGVKFDVVTHSRGGLVLRSFVELSGGHEYVDKVIMVACPAGGTSLADTDKWDSLAKMINHLTNVFFLAGGTSMKIFFSVVGGIIKFLSKKIDDPKAIPGIWAMNPNSEFIKDLNKKKAIGGRVYYNTIGSEFEPSGILQDGIKDEILDGIADAFFGVPNDLVVDTDKMVVPWPTGIQSGEDYNYKSSDHVYHLNYFLQAVTYEKLAEYFGVNLEGAIEECVSGGLLEDSKKET